MSDRSTPRRILELVDSCRQSIGDLQAGDREELNRWFEQHPDHRSLLSRSIAFDQQVVDAVDDVPVPENLASNLRDFVSQNELPADSSSDVDGEPAEKPTLKPSFWNRRQLLFSGVGVVAAAVVVGLFVSQWIHRPTKSVSALELCRFGRQWVGDVGSNAWHTLANHNGPQFPVPVCEDLVLTPVSGQTFDSEFGETTAYVSKLADGRRVFQFTFRAGDQDFDLPRVLPRSPQYPANRFCAAVCKKGEWVHVIVVEGNANDYQSALKKQFEFA